MNELFISSPWAKTLTNVKSTKTKNQIMTPKPKPKPT